MSTKLNAKDLAAKRYNHKYHTERLCYAAAIREVAQPIAEERDEAVRLLRDLHERFDNDGCVYPGQSLPSDQEHIVAEFLSKYPKP